MGEKPEMGRSGSDEKDSLGTGIPVEDEIEK
jgi:hypothetical protein